MFNDGHGKYYWSLFCVASNYKDLHKIDSSAHYNKLGYRLTKKAKNDCYNCLFSLNQAALEIENKQFKSGLDSIKKAFPLLKKCNLIGNIAASHYYTAKAHQGLNNSNLAVNYYKKVDSIFKDPQMISPKFIGGYKYLINHYKKNGELKNQLFYINRFVAVDSILRHENDNYKDLLKVEYEIPKLLAEKEEIINGMNKKSGCFQTFLIIASALIFILALFLYLQFKKQKILKTRFDNLFEELNKQEKSIREIPEVAIKKNVDELGMSIDVFETLIKKLKVFENQKQYLNNNCTLEKLASEFETNGKYLSKVVNANFGKTFPNYLNELRISFIVEELNVNKSWRNYTINALSKEAGFNNSDSFSSAFEKVTGIKPSFFIKELSIAKKD